MSDDNPIRKHWLLLKADPAREKPLNDIERYIIEDPEKARLVWNEFQSKNQDIPDDLFFKYEAYVNGQREQAEAPNVKKPEDKDKKDKPELQRTTVLSGENKKPEELKKENTQEQSQDVNEAAIPEQTEEERPTTEAQEATSETTSEDQTAIPTKEVPEDKGAPLAQSTTPPTFEQQVEVKMDEAVLALAVDEISGSGKSQEYLDIKEKVVSDWCQSTNHDRESIQAKAFAASNESTKRANKAFAEKFQVQVSQKIIAISQRKYANANSDPVFKKFLEILDEAGKEDANRENVAVTEDKTKKKNIITNVFFRKFNLKAQAYGITTNEASDNPNIIEGKFRIIRDVPVNAQENEFSDYQEPQFYYAEEPSQQGQSRPSRQVFQRRIGNTRSGLSEKESNLAKKFLRGRNPFKGGPGGFLKSLGKKGAGQAARTAITALAGLGWEVWAIIIGAIILIILIILIFHIVLSQNQGGTLTLTKTADKTEVPNPVANSTASDINYTLNVSYDGTFQQIIIDDPIPNNAIFVSADNNPVLLDASGNPTTNPTLVKTATWTLAGNGNAGTGGGGALPSTTTNPALAKFIDDDILKGTGLSGMGSAVLGSSQETGMPWELGLTILERENSFYTNPQACLVKGKSNNPGSLEWGNNGKCAVDSKTPNQVSQFLCSTNGRSFCHFPSLEDGIYAIFHHLTRADLGYPPAMAEYKKTGDPFPVLNIYAPLSDGNDTYGYAKQVQTNTDKWHKAAQAAGVSLIDTGMQNQTVAAVAASPLGKEPQVSFTFDEAKFKSYGFPSPQPVTLPQAELNMWKSEMMPFAIKASQLTNVDVGVLGMWPIYEGIPSVFTDNCQDSSYNPNRVCPDSNWQVGYGVRPMETLNYLQEAFDEMHPGESVQAVGQKVIDESGAVNPKNKITSPSTFPNTTIADIVKNASSNSQKKLLAGILMKDRAISTYVLAKVFQGLQGPNMASKMQWNSNYKPQKIVNYIKAVYDAGISAPPGQGIVVNAGQTSSFTVKIVLKPKLDAIDTYIVNQATAEIIGGQGGTTCTGGQAAGGKTITLDPGHGIPGDSGTAHEEGINLAVGLKLQQDLQAKGFNVVMTRTSQASSINGKTGYFDQLIERANIANNAHSTLFFRIHGNDSGSGYFFMTPDVTGTHKDPNGNFMPTQSNRQKGLDAAHKIADSIQAGGGIGLTQSKNTFRPDSGGGNASAYSGCTGLLTADCFSQVPVTLIEMGNVNDANSPDYKWLTNSNNQALLAERIASGIAAFAGVSTTTGQQCVNNPAPNNSSQACPAGQNRGLQDGYNEGIKTQIRICEVSGPSGTSTLVNSGISKGLDKLLTDYNNSHADSKIGTPEKNTPNGDKLEGFRSMDQQIAMWNRNSCNPATYTTSASKHDCHNGLVAWPGTSNHQMGNAIDFECYVNGVWNGYSNSNFVSTPCYSWLQNNASKYGLKPYTREAWHWSTTGQ